MLPRAAAARYYGGLRAGLSWLRPLGWRHFRVRLDEGRWLKLNRLARRGRIRSEGELFGLLARVAPSSAYVSVMRWLFPERVGRKCRANRAVPLGGHLFIDVDSNRLRVRLGRELIDRRLGRWEVNVESLRYAKLRALHLCDLLQAYYDPVDILVVFSGHRGFHIHVLSFRAEDWARRRPSDPIRFEAAARFRIMRELQAMGAGLDRHHFTLAVDPMRVFTLPWSLRLETGLAAVPVGTPVNLEWTTVEEVLERASEPVWPVRYVSAAELLRIRRPRLARWKNALTPSSVRRLRTSSCGGA